MGPNEANRGDTASGELPGPIKERVTCKISIIESRMKRGTCMGREKSRYKLTKRTGI